MEDKIKALSEYLGVDVDEIESASYDDTVLEHYSCEYLVLTDEEADEKAMDYIKDSLWAFNANFILSECELDQSGAGSLRTMQEKSCESANDFILSLVEGTCGLDEFADSAISADGRGHFIATYDGEEIEQGEYFIYQTH